MHLVSSVTSIEDPSLTQDTAPLHASPPYISTHAFTRPPLVHDKEHMVPGGRLRASFVLISYLPGGSDCALARIPRYSCPPWINQPTAHGQTLSLLQHHHPSGAQETTRRLHPRRFSISHMHDQQAETCIPERYTTSGPMHPCPLDALCAGTLGSCCIQWRLIGCPRRPARQHDNQVMWVEPIAANIAVGTLSGIGSSAVTGPGSIQGVCRKYSRQECRQRPPHQ